LPFAKIPFLIIKKVARPLRARSRTSGRSVRFIVKRSGERDESASDGTRRELSEVDAIERNRQAVHRVIVIIANVLFWEEHGLGLGGLDLAVAQPPPKTYFEAHVSEMIHLRHRIQFDAFPPNGEISCVVGAQGIVDTKEAMLTGTGPTPSKMASGHF
jgi:hypothetical protein